MSLYGDDVFAPLDQDLHMERIGGGFETEVYRTDDRRYVVKLKCEIGGTLATAMAEAVGMRAAAEAFADCLGPAHSLPNYYLLARDSRHRIQVLVVQPFIHGAHPLSAVDYARLSPAERRVVAEELRDIVRRALRFYRCSGSMPDLYGQTSAGREQRRRSKSLWNLPARLWSFLVVRTLLRSHNLMLVDGPAPRVVLVDYDTVRRSRLYRRVYFAVRWVLFWRDHIAVLLMARGAHVSPVPH